MFTLTVAILVCLAIAGQVQSYPHHKAEMQTFETALIMRLLHDSMAHTQAKECDADNDNQANVLTEDILGAMTNVFTHQSNNQRTYLYVSKAQTGTRGRELNVRSTGGQSGTNHAEDIMYNALQPNLPREFWLTKTPCPQCARNLIARYATSIHKPVIRVVHFFSLYPNGSAQKELSIECMAKMMHNGFTFLLWDWKKFRNDFLETEECKNIVTNAITTYNNQLKDELAATTSAILKASNYADEIDSGDVDENDLCQP